jgi:putative oxidoreductase
MLGIPAFFSVLAILAEFLGGIGLMVGFLSRIAGFAIAIEMMVAVFLVHLPNGFFMNSSGNKAGEGFEFHLLAIVIAAAVSVRGAGAMSLERAIEWSRPVHPHPYAEPSRG